MFAELIRKEFIVGNIRVGRSWHPRASEMILTKKSVAKHKWSENFTDPHSRKVFMMQFRNT